jgi:hypothetical protein
VQCRCIKGLFARCLQVTENLTPNSRKSDRIKPCVLIQRLVTTLQTEDRTELFRIFREAVTPEFRLGFLVDTLGDEPTMINVVASELRLDYAICVRSGVAELAVDAAESLQAANSLEQILSHQIAAARMMQVYQEGLLTLQKLRTGGKQTVVVQHVQVSEGGRWLREAWNPGMWLGAEEKQNHRGTSVGYVRVRSYTGVGADARLHCNRNPLN